MIQHCPPGGKDGVVIDDTAVSQTSPIEPYMGRPQDNADARASNLPLASRLEGKLLMTIGTTDVNVTFNHTMRMADAFIKADKHFDLLVMPEESHGLTPAGLAWSGPRRSRSLPGR